MATNTNKSNSGEMTQTTEKEAGCDTSIFIVGISGAGKSSLCNFLANKEVFEEGGSDMSVPQEAAHFMFQFEKKNVFIIDSPGLCDSIRSDNEIFNELCKVGVIAKDGTDAVALVININERFGDNHRKAFTMLEQMGGDFWEHTFIVFTNENELLKRRKVKTGEEYLAKVTRDAKCPPILKETLAKTENRFIFVDCIEYFQNEDVRNEKCHKIFEIIEQIRAKNDNKRYNNGLMVQGRKLFEEMADALEKEKQLQEMLAAKTKEFEDQKNDTVAAEERRIDALRQEEWKKELTEMLKKQQEEILMKFQAELDVARKREYAVEQPLLKEIGELKIRNRNSEHDLEVERERRKELEERLRREEKRHDALREYVSALRESPRNRNNTEKM